MVENMTISVGQTYFASDDIKFHLSLHYNRPTVVFLFVHTNLSSQLNLLQFPGGKKHLKHFACKIGIAQFAISGGII